MTLIHRIVLYGLLGILGISLVSSGVAELFRTSDGKAWLVAETPDADSQLRAFNGMMAGLGLIAFWCLFNLQNARTLVMALGVILIPVIIGRIYAIIEDGMPGTMTWVYLCIEIVMVLAFLIWPPPRH